METIKNLNDHDDWGNKTGGHGGLYVASPIAHVQQADGRSFRITDCANALERGKTCANFTLRVEYHGAKDDCAVWNEILRPIADYDLAKLLPWLYSLAWQARKYPGSYESIQFGDDITIYRSDEDSNRTFHPAKIGKLKPLTEKPKKWTLPHALRLIANGQFEGLRCKGVYTDDYAFDNAVKYQEGEIKVPLAFVQRILESPSGWRVYAGSNNELSICCHSFDNNSLTIKI